jgi:hypothetical protein
MAFEAQLKAWCKTKFRLLKFMSRPHPPERLFYDMPLTLFIDMPLSGNEVDLCVQREWMPVSLLRQCVLHCLFIDQISNKSQLGKAASGAALQ